MMLWMWSLERVLQDYNRKDYCRKPKLIDFTIDNPSSSERSPHPWELTWFQEILIYFYHISLSLLTSYPTLFHHGLRLTSTHKNHEMSCLHTERFNKKHAYKTRHHSVRLPLSSPRWNWYTCSPLTEQLFWVFGGSVFKMGTHRPSDTVEVVRAFPERFETTWILGSFFWKKKTLSSVMCSVPVQHQITRFLTRKISKSRQINSNTDV